MSLLSSFPLLLPERIDAGNQSSESWHGVIQCGEEKLRIRVVSSGGSGSSNRLAPAPPINSNSTSSLSNILALSTHRACSAASSNAAGVAASPRHLLLQGDPALKQMLSGYQSMLTQRWQQSVDLRAFLIELQEIVTRILRSNGNNGSNGAATSSTILSPLSSPLPPASLYASLLHDIALLPGGWSCVQSIDAKTARNIALTITDAAKREHVMHVKLPEDYPRSSPSVQVDLPLPFDGTPQLAQAATSTSAAPASSSSSAVSASSSSLCSLYSRFTSLVASCQLFWAVLSDLGDHSWILEPEAPIPKSATHRRIAIGKSCWLELTVNPLHPTSIPELRLLGNENIVAPLQATLRSHLIAGHWEEKVGDDPDSTTAASSLRRNLLRVLELDSFPLATPLNRDEFRLECQVCYTYKLDEATPDWMCPNPPCSRPAHSSCLVSWLQALPTTRTLYTVMYGLCPNCSHKITVNQA